MKREDDLEKSDGLSELDEQRRLFLKASVAGALGGSSLPLVSGSAAGSTSSSTRPNLWEEDFEDIPLGGAPADWTKDEGSTPFAIYQVEEGGAAGSQRSFHMKTDPFQGHTNEDGTEDWGSVVYTPNVNTAASEIQWYWKKPHKWDPENYHSLAERGPSVIFLNENGDGFLSIMLGAEDGYLTNNDYPLGLRISDGREVVYIRDVYEADVFSKFVVKPDFKAETFELLVDGTSLGTFGFRRSASELSRVRFHVGGWGVSGNCYVDQFRISGLPKRGGTGNGKRDEITFDRTNFIKQKQGQSLLEKRDNIHKGFITDSGSFYGRQLVGAAFNGQRSFASSGFGVENFEPDVSGDHQFRLKYSVSGQSAVRSQSYPPLPVYGQNFLLFRLAVQDPGGSIIKTRDVVYNKAVPEVDDAVIDIMSDVFLELVTRGHPLSRAALTLRDILSAAEGGDNPLNEGYQESREITLPLGLGQGKEYTVISEVYSSSGIKLLFDFLGDRPAWGIADFIFSGDLDLAIQSQG